MIPLSDENPTLRTPIVTYLILAVMYGVWILVQGAGLDAVRLAVSVCDLGLVPGELTHRAPLGMAVPIAPGLACVIDNQAINVLTPLISMFLHGSWGHILANSLYFWIFGNNVEDSMGRGRFLVFYLLCGLAAAGAHVLVNPGSPVPTVGASGAISGIMGAYLVLYPRVRVRLFIPPFFLFSVAAWAVLIFWFLAQVLAGLPELSPINPRASSGTAFWAHIGGFVTGAVLIKVFEDRRRVAERTMIRHELHPMSP
jgi:membrane associated rhomboid family serine protease